MADYESDTLSSLVLHWNKNTSPYRQSSLKPQKP